MRKMTVRFQRRRRQIVKSALVAFAVFLMAVAAAGCEYGPSAASSAASGEDSGAASGEDSGAVSSDDSSEDSAAASSEDSSEDSDTSAADQTVSIENPGDEGIDFNNAQNVALLHAEPLDLVTWTVEPVMGAGELVAEGILAEIRVYGYDGEGNEALLSKQTMGGQ